MRVYWPLIGKRYEAKLSNAFELSRHHVIKTTDTESFFEGLISLYSEMCNSCTIEAAYIIIDIDQVDLLNAIIKLSSAFDRRLQRPIRLIVVSTLLTWSGCWPKESRSDASRIFFSRTPATCAVDSYLLENRLWESSLALCNLQLSLISVGLLHGENGWDFEEYFNKYWFGRLNSVSSPNLPLPSFNLSEEACLPTIHISGFVNIVLGALSSQHDNSLPIFYPAVDMKGEPVSHEQLPGNLISLPPDDTAEIVTNDRMGLLWSSTLEFKEQLLDSRSHKNLASSYNEFRCSRGLMPFKALVVGGPCSGKSAVCRELSLRFQVPVITAADALHFVATSPIVAANDPTKASLLATIEARSVEKDGKKGAKKDQQHASISMREVDLGSYDFASEAFIAFIAPSQIVRKCVVAMVLLSPILQQKGFVLDLWRHETFDGPDGILETMRVPPAGEEDNVIVIEVQMTAAEASQRFLEIVGVAEDGKGAKLSKEQQAALKAFEASTESYSARLVQVQLSDGLESDAGPAGATVIGSHLHVVELSKRSRCSVIRQRYSGSLKEDVMPRLESKIRDVRGTVGWLDAPHDNDANAPPLQNDEPLGSCADEGDDSWNFVKLASDRRSDEKPTRTSVGDEEEKPFTRINDDLSHLTGDVRAMLIENCTELQDYLVTNVLPVVAKGLVEVHRRHPADPLRYMIDFLEEQGDRLEAAAEAEARERFYAILAAAAASE